MPFPNPVAFPLRPALGAGLVRELQDITTEGGLQILGAEHHAYAQAGRSNLLSWTNEHGMRTSAGTTYVERLRSTGKLGEHRDTLEVLLEGEAAKVRVRLFDDDGVTLLDTGEATFAVGVRNTATFTLDAGVEGREVIVVLDLAQVDVGETAILYGVEALESVVDIDAVGASATELGFQRTSDRAFTRNEFLSCDVPQRMANSTRAAQKARLRSSRIVWDRLNPPRFCGLRRVVYTALVPLTQNLLGARLFYTHRVHLGVKVGVILRRANDLQRAPVEVPLVEVDVDDSSGELVTTELVLEPDVLSDPLVGLAGDAIGVMITIESVQDVDNEAFLKSITGPDEDSWISSWVGNRVYGYGAPSATTGGAPWVEREVPQAALRFGVRTWKNPENHASGDRESDASEFAGLLPAPPASTQVIFAPTTAALTVEAPILTVDANVADFWYAAYWVPLGYSEPACLEIRETQIQSYPGYGIQFNARQDVAAASERMIYREAYQIFQAHGRVLGVGAASNPFREVHPYSALQNGATADVSFTWWGQDGVSNPAAGLVYVGYKHGHCYLPGTTQKPGGGEATWGRGACATYGQTEQFEDGIVEGDQAKRWYEAIVLVRAIGKSEGEIETRLRMVAEDAVTGADVVEGETLTRRIAFDGQGYDDVPSGSLKGVQSAQRWQSSGLQLVRLSLEDTFVQTSDKRRVALEIQAADRAVGDAAPQQDQRQSDGGFATTFYHIEVVSWACWLAPVPRER